MLKIDADFEYNLNIRIQHKISDNFMYEKKSELSHPAPISDEISVRLSGAVHRNINDKCAIFL